MPLIPAFEQTVLYLRTAPMVEVPLSKAPNPQLLPGRCIVWLPTAPALCAHLCKCVCVCVCLFVCLCVFVQYMGGLNVELSFSFGNEYSIQYPKNGLTFLLR